jgi:hypothetical protein
MTCMVDLENTWFFLYTMNHTLFQVFMLNEIAGFTPRLRIVQIDAVPMYCKVR